MSVIRNQKSLLRKQITEKLKSLSNEEVKRQSEKVAEKVLRLPAYGQAARISIYLNMPEHEIETGSILADIFDKGKECFVPRFESNIMQMLRLNDMEDFKNLPATKWNIKQPANCDVREDAIVTGGLDLIVMPGVAFTKEGHRLGHGKGYYDTFLHNYCEKFQKAPFLVGLALKEQLVPEVPLTDRDYKVDEILYTD